MKVVVTGSDGFLGWHLRVAMRAAGEHEVVAVNRGALSDTGELDPALAGCDAVVHMAGVNRGDPATVERANIDLARALVAGLERTGGRPAVVYANSVQAGRDTPYGRGKRRAAEILQSWADRAGGALVDIRLCNVFGEHGRPYYNSVVATFCHELATGGKPTVIEDRPIELVHAQQVAALIQAELSAPGDSRVVETSGTVTGVGELLARLEEISATYRRGQIPSLLDDFSLDLFNTYRAYLFPTWYPQPLVAHADQRGHFVELVRSEAGQSQASFSTTATGITRGDHFHLRKIERFVVLSGQAVIRIRPVLGTEVSSFPVSGEEPVFIDMPTLCTHNITNTGESTLYTAFWVNELFDEHRPDTYREPVG